MSSLNYFEEKAVDWDQMGTSFFGEAPRQSIYQQIDWSSIRSIADIGTGTGYLLANVPSSVKRYAIDQSPEMLKIVADRYQDVNLETIVADGHAIPMETALVDLVVANMYLHHADDPEEAIGEMVRILAHGGQLIFTDLDSHNHRFLIEEQHDRWMGFERSDIMRWMEKAGLEEVMIDCVGSDCCANSGCSSDAAKISIFIAKGLKK